MAEIKNLGGRPAIFIDGVPYPPMMATIRTMKDGREIIFDEKYFENLGKSGIKIFFLICDTEWLKPTAIELFRNEAEQLLKAVPDAYIIPRIGMHPPRSWVREHPEECVTYSDGRKPSVHLFSESYEDDYEMHYSLSSELWRRDASQALADTWGKLMKLPYADRIIGCFLAAGGTSEWYYMLPAVDENNKAVFGHSAAFKREFSEYLRERYGTDEALRLAWGDPAASIENPKIPEYDEHFFVDRVDKLAAVPGIRMYTNNPPPPDPCNGNNLGSFPDMNKSTRVYDFYRALNLGTANSVLAFAKVIKDMTPDKLVGAFYGSQGCTIWVSAGTAGGTVKILNSGLVDFLAAPGVYENRMAGGSVGQREVQDSFAMHNMIYIVEDDTRTHAENKYFMDRCQIYDECDTLNIMKREFGRTLCEDVQAWWFDQLIGGRRYKFPKVYELISAQQAIAKEAYTLDRRKGTEIAFIFDEESMQASSIQTTRDAVELMRNYEMAKIGAPVDQYYHNDMADPAMPSYKLYVFINCYLITEEERRVIHEKLRRDGAVALWLYAPGFIDPEAEDKMSVDNIERLTGIKCAMENERLDAVFRWSGEEHPISERLDRRRLYGKFDRKRTLMLLSSADGASYYDTYLYPLFHSVDPDAKDLAYFTVSGYPAVSFKELDGFRSIYYGSKFIHCDILREIARFAGCHIYSDEDDTLYANDNYVTHHASTSGRKKLCFKEAVSPFEVYEKRFYGHSVTEIEFDSYLGQTRMFRLIKE